MLRFATLAPFASFIALPEAAAPADPGRTADCCPDAPAAGWAFDPADSMAGCVEHAAASASGATRATSFVFMGLSPFSVDVTSKRGGSPCRAPPLTLTQPLLTQLLGKYPLPKLKPALRAARRLGARHSASY